MNEFAERILLKEAEARFDTSIDAEDAFYEAFESRNLSLMMQIWADDEQISCIHPLGAHLRGRRAIQRSWREIFAGSEGMHISRKLNFCVEQDDVVIHCVTETIELSGEKGSRTPVTTTNIFRRTEAGWRLVLHHASPLAHEVDPLSTLH